MAKSSNDEVSSDLEAFGYRLAALRRLDIDDAGVRDLEVNSLLRGDISRGVDRALFLYLATEDDGHLTREVQDTLGGLHNQTREGLPPIYNGNGSVTRRVKRLADYVLSLEPRR